MTIPVPRETGRSGVMRAVTDLLTAERIFWLRMNSGDRIVPGKNGKRYRIKGHSAGTADILMFDGSQPIWIECKRPGEQQTPEQREFEALVRFADHTYLIIEDAAELQAWLRGHRT